VLAPVVRGVQVAPAGVGPPAQFLELDQGVLPEAAASAIRARLVATGFSGDEVLIRFFGYERSRLERLRTTGTDRDHGSSVYTQGDTFFRGNDADPKTRAALGIQPQRVTYCLRLRWREEPMRLVWGGQLERSYPERSMPLSEHIAPTKPPKPKWPGVGSIALYDPKQLRRAPGAEVEYWFNGPPSDALLLCLAASRAHWEKVAGPRFAKYIFEGVVTG
jgi:hypothetical protein